MTDEATRRIEQAAFQTGQKLSNTEDSIVRLVHRSVGQVALRERSVQMRVSGSHVGAVAVELIDGESRDVTSEEFISDWRLSAGSFPGVESLVFKTENIGPGGKAVEFKLLARSDPDAIRQLEEVAERCKEWLAQYPGVIDIVMILDQVSGVSTVSSPKLKQWACLSGILPEPFGRVTTAKR